MEEKIIDYFDGDHCLKGRLFWQETSQKQSAIVLYHAFEGLSEFLTDYAKALVNKGFVVFAADMYGNGEVADTLPGCFDLIGPHLKDRSLVRRRAQLAYQQLINQTMIDKHNIHAMGFCFGGMCALELARSGASLQSVVPIHAVLSRSDLPTAKMTARFLVLHGYQDPQVPPAILTEFADELIQAETDDWTFVFFGQAKHSFTDPKTGTFDPVEEQKMGREYHEKVANRAFHYAVSFMQE